MFTQVRVRVGTETYRRLPIPHTRSFRQAMRSAWKVIAGLRHPGKAEIVEIE